MFKKSAVIFTALLLCLLCACTPAAQVSGDEINTASPPPTVSATPEPSVTLKPPVTIETVERQPELKYVIFLIGDGMGEAHKTLAEAFLKHISGDENAVLNLNSMNINSMITTKSANASITDSAAAATAFATGIKTNNGMIGMNPDGKQLTTILEAAKDAGLAAGIVTTTSVTHATPSCFYAHTNSRSNEDDIALQLSDADIDFIAGGGLSFFLPKELPEKYLLLLHDARGINIYSARDDSVNLVDMFAEKGYHMFLGPQGADHFLNYDPIPGDKVFAALTYSYMPYEIDRLAKGGNLASLAEMTKQAIRLLSLDEDGFFLMVEGGRIDYAAHNNDALGIIYDTLAFDNAVGAALEFYTEHPQETLVITTADHETGGLTLLSGTDFSDSFNSVSGIMASYGDGFALLYEPLMNFDLYLSKVKALGLVPDEQELILLTNEFNKTNLIDYEPGDIDTAASLAINSILNERIGVRWTAISHTSAKVALGVTGVFEDRFEAATDNTDIAKILAEVMGLDIGL